MRLGYAGRIGAITGKRGPIHVRGSAPAGRSRNGRAGGTVSTHAIRFRLRHRACLLNGMEAGVRVHHGRRRHRMMQMVAGRRVHVRRRGEQRHGNQCRESAGHQGTA